MNTKIIIPIIALGAIGLAALIYPAPTMNPERVKLVIAQSDLKQIYLSCRIYAEDNDGRLPPDWAVLFTNYLAIDGLPVFVTRQNRDKIGAPDQVMEWTDYVYVRGFTTASPPWTIIAYLPAGHIKSKTPFLVAYLDGNIEALSLSDFTKAMNKSPQPSVAGHPPQGVGSPEP
jgi:hypothetical protein